MLTRRLQQGSPPRNQESVGFSPLPAIRSGGAVVGRQNLAAVAAARGFRIADAIWNSPRGPLLHSFARRAP